MVCFHNCHAACFHFIYILGALVMLFSEFLKILDPRIHTFRYEVCPVSMIDTRRIQHRWPKLLFPSEKVISFSTFWHSHFPLSSPFILFPRLKGKNRESVQFSPGWGIELGIFRIASTSGCLRDSERQQEQKPPVHLWNSPANADSAVGQVTGT